jgi:hypothetical protein
MDTLMRMGSALATGLNENSNRECDKRRVVAGGALGATIAALLFKTMRWGRRFLPRTQMNRAMLFCAETAPAQNANENKGTR